MNATTVTPEQLLASEPKFHRGIDTPMRREASRTITYTWEVGEGDKWKETGGSPNERVMFKAVLTINHHKKGRSVAHYRATLWQHQEDLGTGLTGCMFDARNGLYICTDANGAGRYNANKLGAFAEHALKQMRERVQDPRPAAGGQDVLAYFKPERV